MEKDNLRIQLGGGETPKEGYTNIDILPLPEVDIVADITKGLPLPDNSVTEVSADYLFEHIPDTVLLMKELYRVCKPGARLRIKVPYFKSTAAFKDPTHVSFFTERTFEYFDARIIKKGALPEYQLNVDFRTESITFNYYTRGTKYLPFVGLLRRFCWDIVKSIVIELRVVK
jgi:SAM-dependent methyltransferase